MIQKKDLRNAQSPMYAYKVITNLPKRLRTLQHAIAHKTNINMIQYQAPGLASLIVEFNLYKAHTLKACT
jgi:hypothetical protein